MKLIQPFAPLIEGGMTLTLKLSRAGDGTVQLDILPVGKDTKTGVGLPPRALVGTAKDLDDNLEAFIEKYAPSVERVTEVLGNADVALKAIEDEAEQQSKAAIEAKKSKSTPAKSGSKPATPAPKRDMTAGLINEDDDGSDEHENDNAGSNTTLGTASDSTVDGGAAGPVGASEQPVPAGGQGADLPGLSSSLFTM